MQVVHDGRLPVEERLRDIAREREELPHAVAVVVVGDVLAPVHQRQPRISLRALLVEVVGVDLLLAAVDFDDRRDERDDVVADLLDERRFAHRQAVWQLDQHFRTAVLGRVHAARDPVDRLGRSNQLLRLLFGRLSRIGQRRDHALVLVDLFDRRFIGDRQGDHVAAFFGLADVPHRDAIRRLVDGFVVAVDVFRVGQLARSSDNPSEKLERRRHRVGRRAGGRPVRSKSSGPAGIP